MERRKDGTYGTVELERKYVGQMYGGDCYVIQYTYTARGRENHIVYFWLVCHSYLLIYLFVCSVCKISVVMGSASVSRTGFADFSPLRDRAKQFVT